MPRSSAHLSLRPWRISARGALWVIMISMCSNGCLLPSDGLDPIDTSNHAPYFDLQSQSPSQVFTRRVPPFGNCGFDVLIDVLDPDEENISFRWVADNNTNLVVFIEDENNFPIIEGRAQIKRRINTQRDLIGPLPSTSHAISLFVNDGAEWAATREEIDAREKIDAGRIVRTSTGTVIAATWFVTFESGACE